MQMIERESEWTKKRLKKECEDAEEANPLDFMTRQEEHTQNRLCLCPWDLMQKLEQSKLTPASPTIAGWQISLHHWQGLGEEPRCKWSTNEGTAALKLEKGDKRALLFPASSYSLLPKRTETLARVWIYLHAILLKWIKLKKKKVPHLNILTVVACASNSSTWVVIGIFEVSF